MNGDKENRKTAYMLRKLVDDSDLDIHHDDVFNELGIGTRDGFLYFADVLVLADMIDRPTCRNALREEDFPNIDFRCSRCGLTWAFRYGDLEENEFFYCPKCGAEVVE